MNKNLVVLLITLFFAVAAMSQILPPRMQHCQWGRGHPRWCEQLDDCVYCVVHMWFDGQKVPNQCYPVEEIHKLPPENATCYPNGGAPFPTSEVDSFQALESKGPSQFIGLELVAPNVTEEVVEN